MRRAERFAREDDYRAFVLVRARLRRRLGMALGAEPASLTFTLGPAGKPALADDPGLHFNVTHTRGLGLIAITRAGPVGIDVEALRDVPEMDAIAASQFPANERAQLAAAPRVARAALFLTFWTRREALLKAVGTGFSGDPAPDPRGWTIAPLAVSDDHIATLAHPPGSRAVLHPEPA